MTTIKHSHLSLDLACELSGAEVGERGNEWRSLRMNYGTGSDRIPGGARIWLDRAGEAIAADLARREAECCAFLDIELASEGDRLRLDITSPVNEAQPVIDALAGTGPG